MPQRRRTPCSASRYAWPTRPSAPNSRTSLCLRRADHASNRHRLPSGLAGRHGRTGASGACAGIGRHRGRYVIRIAGCNDCHTPGYLAADGKIDAELWLTGDALGWRGCWGTTINLRLYMAGLMQQQWLDKVKTMQPRPPMPFFNVQAMSVEDQKAVYQFIKSFGPDGQNAPAWAPPDKAPPQPCVQFSG